MSINVPDESSEAPVQHRRAQMHPAWYAAIVLLLGACVYFAFATQRLTQTTTQLQDALKAESARADQNASAAADNRQRLEALSVEAQKSLADALNQARSEAHRSSARVATSLGAKLEAEQQQ